MQTVKKPLLNADSVAFDAPAKSLATLPKNSPQYCSSTLTALGSEVPIPILPSTLLLLAVMETVGAAVAVAVAARTIGTGMGTVATTPVSQHWQCWG
jgi:hypothetical protein